jgi:hypothetical protein
VVDGVFPGMAVDRNGCSVCDFVVTSQCDSDADCPASGQHCYRGQRCTENCAGPGCCINGCARPGCTTPMPLGCHLAPYFCSGDSCLFTSCVCVDGAWQCGAHPSTQPPECEYSP